MINLLPIQDKKNIKKEFLRRFIVVLSVCLLLLIVTKIILSLSLFSCLTFLEKNLNEQLISVEHLARLKTIDKLEAETKEVNQLLSVLQNAQEKSHIFSDNVSQILEILPSSVKINSFYFEKNDNKPKPKITLGGEAITRTGLLSFVEKLKSNIRFKEVTLPVSSLLTERDVDFSITIELR